ncbi:MAG TPA: PfkB family carbohydrate kinase [Candidatus Marinimicrobia bacterium]|nr:PfkB family carbohydrate kinase [Candidatus Neomarinimicrobiota bacterium]HRS51931.1 PfkB family carbohydrate kinase [Candidatus Neomarinimicrobiota bacterium]HRU92940.1 PfkB family carbohydrate kinase [Candidatus Neomarinimicrobiota bacterium]
MNKSILVVGSVAFDDIETPVGKRFNALGGSAVYFSLAASRFSQVNLVGVAGEDYPQAAINLLNRQGIDTTGLEIARGATFRWGGRYHQDLNNRDTLYTHLNVFANFSPKIPAVYQKTSVVFLGNIQPTLQMEVLNQLPQPEFIGLDTMNLWINTTRAELMEIIPRVNLLVINDSELAELTGSVNLFKGLKYLHKLGVRYIVIKRGEYGSILSAAEGLFFTPAYPVEEVVDPTGAGDSFAGGLFGYLGTCEKIDFITLKKAVVYGSVMGSFCVENFSIDGLLNLNPSRIAKRYRELRRLVKA